MKLPEANIWKEALDKEFTGSIVSDAIEYVVRLSDVKPIIFLASLYLNLLVRWVGVIKDI